EAHAEALSGAVLRPVSAARPQACRHGRNRALVDRGAIPVAKDGVVGGARLPGAAALPTVAFQEIRGRGEDVGHRVDEIAPAIAVEVDGVLDIGAWQKLRVPDFTGPAAAKLRRSHIAALDD